MTANKGQAFMGLAVVLGLAAAAVGYFGLNSLATRAAQGAMGDLHDVVVTSSDLTYGVKLEKTMLRVVKYPKESVPAGAFSSVDSVVGQTTKVFMSAREPVTALKLSSRGGGLSMLIRTNMRAASLEVNQVSGVSGFVLPGDRVDVLVTVDRVQNPEDAYTRTILQNVEVLAAGQKTSQQDNKPITVQAVTVLVDPESAEILAHAMREGQITLSLRHPDDQDTVKTTPFTSNGLRGQRVVEKRSGPVTHSAPVVKVIEKKPAEPKNVRIIRSANVSEQKLPSDSLQNQ